MAKALKIAAIVVGVVAVAVTAGAALGLLPAFIPALGISMATLGTILTVTGTLLSLAAGFLTKPPKLSSAGTALDFVADPTSGQPYVMGDTRVGEAIVHQASWGDKNRFLGIIGVISCAGPLQSYDGLYADGTLINFAGGDAVGYYHDFMYHTTQLGNRPEAAALPMAVGGAMPDWGPTYKLSSLAASGLILKADIDKGKIFSGGVPQLTHQVHGVSAYDPRLDGTNGGVGAERMLDETTYGYSENPWVHHGTFAMGRWVNGIRVIGPGMPIGSIDWAQHIEAANIADANGWKIAGRVLSTDAKWDALKSIAQAGGGYPIPSGTKLYCLVNAPRVSLATINESDLRGPVSAPQTAMRRDRKNRGVPRFVSPDHEWQIVSADAISNPDYLTEDRNERRTVEVEMALVTDKVQAAQLTAYQVANTREKTGISVELGLVWSQYKTGDCLTLNLPSANLTNQKAVVIGRSFDPTKNTITLMFRTETDAKHTWALGQGGTAPPATTVIFPPGTGDIPTVGSTVMRSSYAKGLVATSSDAGASASIHIDAFTIAYASATPLDVAVPAGDIVGLAYSTDYFLFADVAEPGDPAPVYGATTVYADGVNSEAHPNRIWLNYSVATPAAGGATTTGGGETGGYGGRTTGGFIP